MGMQILHARHGFAPKESERITEFVINYFSLIIEEC